MTCTAKALLFMSSRQTFALGIGSGRRNSSMDTKRVFSLSPSGSDSTGEGLGGRRGCVSGTSSRSVPGTMTLGMLGVGDDLCGMGSSRKSETEVMERCGPGTSVTLLSSIVAVRAPLGCAGGVRALAVGICTGTGTGVGTAFGAGTVSCG